MMTCAQRRTFAPSLCLAAALAGCGGEGVTGTGNGNGNGNPDNVAPTLQAIGEQTVGRNTLSPRSVTVDLVIDDPDDNSFSVTATSDNEAVLPATEMTCGADACQLTLTPAVEENEDVTVTVVVADGKEGEDEASFVVHVQPSQVVTTLDDAGAGSLRQAIADAEPGDVIGFDTDGAFATPQTITVLEQLVLDKSVQVEGPESLDLTVSGGDAVRVFKVVDGAEVTLLGLIIADGLALTEEIERPDGQIVSIPIGGGVFVGPGSTLTLGLVRVTGSAAAGAAATGGGIAVVGGTLTVSLSEIHDNSAEAGGGIGNLGGTVVLDPGEVLGNTAVVGGGVYNEGTLDVLTSVIAMNVATGNSGVNGGGGIFNAEEGVARIVESTLEGNDAMDGGGGIRNAGELTVTGAAIRDNRADADGDGNGLGGGIADEAEATVTVVSTIIERNSAAAGGGVFVIGAGSLVVEDCEILDNESALLGGGIMLNGGGDGELEVIRTTIADNSAVDGGGGVTFLGARMEMVESVITGNHGVQFGGGLYLGAATTAVVTVESTVIEANTAANDGGGLFFTSSSTVNSLLTIQGGTQVIGNTADDGAGIFVTSNLDVVIEETFVQQNVATDLGGGIYSAATLLLIQGFTSIDNNTAREGGGIYGSSEEILMNDDSVVIANRATGDGGGVYLSGSTLTVNGTFCMILGNFADDDEDGDGEGGGIYNDAGDISGVPTARVCLNSPDDFAP